MIMVRLAIDGLRHYWRLSFCLFLGVFIGSAILTGSLLVGDSVKQTLLNNAGLRIGSVKQAVITGERFITEKLTDRIAAALPGKNTAGVLLATGIISTPDKKSRVNGVRVYGVNEDFWKLAGRDAPMGTYLALGEPLADRMKLSLGDQVIARMEMPGRVSREAPLSGETEEIASINAPVTNVISAQHMGRFSLVSEQSDSLNIFVPLSLLQDKLNKAGRVNLLLSSADKEIQPLIEANWKLPDAELYLKRFNDAESVIFSDRVFISREVETAVISSYPESEGVLSYLVNDFYRVESRVPYSVAVGIGPSAAERLGVNVPGPGEMIINDWLGLPPSEGGLSLNNSDNVDISFYAVTDSRKFIVVGDGKSSSGSPDPTDRVSFRVSDSVERDSKALSGKWVPDFPGLETAQSLATWKSGLPIDTKKIRESDELFWDKYKATPKAFISLAQAQELWGNRFGRVTGIHLGETVPDGDALASKLRANLKFSNLGISVRKLSVETRKSVDGALDFGALFASLSGFLIISSILLVSLLCVFGMQSRSSQIGLMGAIGFTPRMIHRLFLCEAAVICLAGSAMGVLGGVGYTKLALVALSGVWKGAATGVDFVFHITFDSLFSGAVTIFAIALLSIYFAGRKLVAVQSRALLAGSFTECDEIPSLRRKMLLFIGTFMSAGCATALVWFGLGLEGEQLAGSFFGAGFFMLLSGIGVFLLILEGKRFRQRAVSTITSLALSNLLRNKGRSLSVVGMVSGGVFLVSAVNAFRLADDSSAVGRETGTGGFQFIGTTSLPVYEDLNNMKIRDKFGLEDFGISELSFVQMRIGKDGEEASCLNLSQASRPRILGVDPLELSKRNAFRFASFEANNQNFDSPWELLQLHNNTDAIPVIGDKASVMWALKKNLGDSILYPDGRGGNVELRIVGLLENSILQGNLLMSDVAYKSVFPDAGGYRFFLVDVTGATPPGEMSSEIMKSLEGQGMSLESSDVRLAAYSRVQNTYITIFSVLGGLGTLLGTAGVGVVIARNVIERRRELALMLAIGFRRRLLMAMLMVEHSVLLLGGVAIGLVAALLTISPSLLRATAPLPLEGIILISALISLGGMFFCLISAKLSLRGPLLKSISNE